MFFEHLFLFSVVQLSKDFDLVFSGETSWVKEECGTAQQSQCPEG